MKHRAGIALNELATRLGGVSLTAKLGLLATLGLTAAWAVASLWFPYGWDQGIHASVGDIIVRGDMPYRDAWDMKGPLTYYVFALAQLLFGRHMWGIRLLDLLLLSGGALALWRLVTALASERAGLWTALGFVLWYASLTWFHVSQPDGWVALLVAIAVASLMVPQGPPSTVGVILSGILIGGCALFKPFYGAFVLVPIAYLSAFVARVGWAGTIRHLLFLGVAAAVPVAAMAGWFLYQGALDELIQVHFMYNLEVYSGLDSFSPVQAVRSIAAYLWTGKIAVVLPATLFGLYVLWRRDRRTAIGVGTWAVAALFCVTVQGKFWVYHWIPLFPPLAVLTGVGLWTAATAADEPTAGSVREGAEGGADAGPVAFARGAGKHLRAYAVIATALFILQVAVTPAEAVVRWLKVPAGRDTLAEHYEQFRRWEYVAGDEIAAARYVRDRTSESDRVLVWGNDATITFLSGRRNATRFVYGMPLTRGEGSSIRADYRAEFTGAIRAAPPPYVIVGLPHGTADKEKTLREFPELRSFLESLYELETQIGFLDLYRLRSPGS